MEKAPETSARETGEHQDVPAARVEPIMEAPEGGSATSPDAVSWNPAQGDRSFGYGTPSAGPSPSEAAAAGGQGDMVEDAP